MCVFNLQKRVNEKTKIGCIALTTWLYNFFDLNSGRFDAMLASSHFVVNAVWVLFFWHFELYAIYITFYQM